MELKRTPLYSVYSDLGGKTVDFGGWEMPVQFCSIIQEHEAVRNRAGLFDVSHMGEFEVAGKDAWKFLQRMVTNDLTPIKPGMAIYSPMVYDNGGCVDDLLVYCFSPEKFWVVVNAGNIDKDYTWFAEHTAGFDMKLVNRSLDIAQIALQGPRAVDILQKQTDIDLSTIHYYRFVEGMVSGIKSVISRTGYTGEDGFELYVDAADATQMWSNLLESGLEYGVLPCGLGARDSLRLEARLPLYGHELAPEITPLEAGLGMFVKLDKGDFVGSQALREQKTRGVPRKIVGIQTIGRGIPRSSQRVLCNGEDVGYVTSGTMSPTLKVPIGLALINIEAAAVNTSLEIDIRGKRIAAIVVKTPFFKRSRS